MNGGTDPKITMDFSKSIYDEAQRMTSLVNDIIKLSKLDEKSIAMEKEALSLRSICREVMETLAVSAKNKNLSVHDTGIGIPSAEKERIFERFYRVDKSRSRSLGGTGLGLSIVKHAAKYHNASILVTSEEGQGSTFTVVFEV